MKVIKLLGLLIVTCTSVCAVDNSALILFRDPTGSTLISADSSFTYGSLTTTLSCEPTCDTFKISSDDNGYSAGYYIGSTTDCGIYSDSSGNLVLKSPGNLYTNASSIYVNASSTYTDPAVKFGDSSSSYHTLKYNESSSCFELVNEGFMSKYLTLSDTGSATLRDATGTYGSGVSVTDDLYIKGEKIDFPDTDGVMITNSGGDMVSLLSLNGVSSALLATVLLSENVYVGSDGSTNAGSANFYSLFTSCPSVGDILVIHDGSSARNGVYYVTDVSGYPSYITLDRTFSGAMSNLDFSMYTNSTAVGTNTYLSSAQYTYWNLDDNDSGGYPSEDFYIRIGSASHQPGIRYSAGTAGSAGSWEYSNDGSTWSSFSSGGSGGAPTDAQYLVLAANSTLTDERVMTGGDGISSTDGGAGGNYTVSVDINGLTEETTTASGDYFMFYDASASALRKVDYDNMPGSGIVDISDDTNLAADAPIVLTDDTLSFDLSSVTNVASLHTGDEFAVREDSTGDNKAITTQKLADSLEGFISHDDLLDYAANEHIDHTSVVLSCGDGLTGGGDITASRSFALDIPGLVHASPTDLTSDSIAFYLNDATKHAKMTLAELATNISGKIDHGDLTGLGDESDHPWAVWTDGTNPLTGNWDVGSYTISSISSIGIGTATVPHASVGISMLAIDGSDSSTSGPHVQVTTDVDDYPLYQLLSWSHDSITQCYDCYFDGTNWKSSDGGSNFRVRKYGDTYRIEAAQSIAQGSAIAVFNTAIKVNSNARVTLNEAQSLDADFMVKTSGFAPLFFVDSSADKIWIGDGLTPTGGYSGVHIEEDYSSLSSSGTTGHVVNASGTLDFTTTVSTDWITSFGVCGLFSANANKTGAGYALYGEAKAVNDASPGSYDDPILIGVEGAAFTRDGWCGYAINAQPYLADSTGSASFLGGLYVSPLQRENSSGSMTCDNFASVYIEEPDPDSLVSGNVYSIYAEAGECAIAPDTDTECTFGRVVLANAYGSDTATFSHCDHNSVTDYALAQNSSGVTSLNCSGSSNINFCIGNTRKMQLHGNGDFSVDTTGFYYDDSTNRIGLGTASPTVQLHVLGSGTAKVGNTGTVLILQHSDTSSRSVGINMISGTSGVCSLFAGDTASTSVAKIEYSNATNKWRFKANNTFVAYLTSGGFFSYTDKGYDLGSSSLSWDDVYADDYYNTCEYPPESIDPSNAILGVKSNIITRADGSTYRHIDFSSLPEWVRGHKKARNSGGMWKGKYYDKDGNVIRKVSVVSDDGKETKEISADHLIDNAVIPDGVEFVGEYSNNLNDAYSLNKMQGLVVLALQDALRRIDELEKDNEELRNAIERCTNYGKLDGGGEK